MQPEARLRARCRLYLDHTLPAPGFYTAIEHGRMHSGTPEQRAREWGRLKAQGVKNGISDLMIWYVGRFIAPEAKVGKNTTSDAQDAFGDAMRANGFSHFVFRSVAELHDNLVGLGVPLPAQMRTLAESYDACLAVPVKAKKATGPRAASPKPTLAQIRKVGAMRKATMF